MGNDAQHGILHHVLHVIIIRHITGTDRSKLSSIMGIEQPDRPVVTLTNRLCYLLLYICTHCAMTCTYYINARVKETCTEKAKKSRR